MEGNWDLALRSVEKPIIVGGTRTYKRPFPLDHYSGQPIVEDPSHDTENLLKAFAGHYSGSCFSCTFGPTHTFFPTTTATRCIILSF